MSGARASIIGFGSLTMLERFESAPLTTLGSGTVFNCLLFVTGVIGNHGVRVHAHQQRLMIMDNIKRIESEIKTRHLFRIKNMIDYHAPVTTEEVNAYGEHSKKLLKYAACLNSAMIDFEKELTKANMFRHSLKRNSTGYHYSWRRLVQLYLRV